VAAVLYGATVTLSDPSAPTLSNPSGDLFAGGWRRGVQDVTFESSDNAGIRKGRVYVDGHVERESTYACDFTFTVPCSDQDGARFLVSTDALSDGTHSVRVAAVDAAGNEAKSTSQTVTVDNTAPTAPQGLSVVGGDGWRSTNSFSVAWADPAAQVSPITTAHYQLCSVPDATCGAAQDVADASRIDGISVPSTGEWSLRVWLEDAAGNVDPTRSATATLRYGSSPSAPTQETAPSSSPTTPTAAPAPLPDPTVSLTSPSLTQAAGFRRDLGLRLTSARLTDGHLVVRGHIASGATARLVFQARTKSGRLFRRAVVIRSHRFSVMLELRDPVGRLTARFAGSPALRPAVASLRPRR
jgi:hypothetical protein